MPKAKKQAQSLTEIAGQSPFLNVAIASYFSGITDELKIYAVDPPIEPTGRSLALALPQPDYLSGYYRPLLDFIQYDRETIEETTIFRKEYLIRRLDEADLWVGLEKNFYSDYIDQQLLQGDCQVPVLQNLFTLHAQNASRLGRLLQEHLAAQNNSKDN